ncbi:MAG: hypothetical protein PVSMB7_25420 [Chloroflexota bacterium]
MTGSIAAFKAAALASDLMSRDVQVRVIMTEGAVRFVQPLTFEGITGEQVTTSIWDERSGGLRMGHLDMARWADLVIVAPASASSIARLALGLADDLLGAVAISTRAPLLIAPAMETGMWTHPATQSHIDTLRQRGVFVIGPGDGRLASGASGTGRMAEPADIDHVRGAGEQRHQLAAVEGGRGDDDVVEMAGALPRVVGHIGVTT